jgi:hypothetical protein
LFPARHGKQVCWLVDGWYVPISHATAADRPDAGHWAPAVHAAHTVKPALSPNVDTRHGVHTSGDTWPASGWKVPAGQGVGAVDVARQYEPAGHTAAAEA